jgi:hypothetical protein
MWRRERGVGNRLDGDVTRALTDNSAHGATIRPQT